MRMLRREVKPGMLDHLGMVGPGGVNQRSPYKESPCRVPCGRVQPMPCNDHVSG